MGGHPFPEISCTICRQPVDLNVDLIADEHGQAVHERCYEKSFLQLDCEVKMPVRRALL